MPEWLNGTVSKTVDSFGVRGFESHLLRHLYQIKAKQLQAVESHGITGFHISMIRVVHHH